MIVKKLTDRWDVKGLLCDVGRTSLACVYEPRGRWWSAPHGAKSLARKDGEYLYSCGIKKYSLQLINLTPVTAARASVSK